MSYIVPEHVSSPKNLFGGLIEIIHDPGEKHMAVARIVWEGEAVLAARWNGHDEKPLGSPTSHGQATWFIIDGYAATELEMAARAAAERSPNGPIARYREMAADVQREKEAAEWTEGLIGDASSQG